ncbi:MAG: SagB/ThcOx family dehydrogenase [Candidatus Palauibacterales bacterium]|nr:SagB/ThcOx family dehydrogenase [Candidatus Palauibacterales bacterium]
MLRTAAVWAAASALLCSGAAPGQAAAQEVDDVVELPEPERTGDVSVETALERRRSRRDFADEPLSLDELGQLLWSAQGVTDRRRGLRAAPSAGALYPLELYVTAGDVSGLRSGIYRYRPGDHELVRTAGGDRRGELARAALNQRWVRSAPAVVVIAAIYERTAERYGDRAERYVHMEVGAASENIYLQAEARDLATVLVGAFHDGRVREVLDLPDDEAPLGLMPVGHRP